MKQTNNANIWVLTDNRTGNSVQAIALAESLGVDFTIKTLKYNFWAKLPNFLLAHSCIYTTAETQKSLKTNIPPKLIISSGRRTAGIAAYLKSIYKDVKLVQIMKPNINTNVFDLIALPQHDVFRDSKSNIIRTIGALNNIPTRIAQYNSILPMHNFIGVLIGGNTKEYCFSEKDTKELATILEKMLTDTGAMAYITFSRRTPDNLKKIFTKKFLSPNLIYDPTISTKDNPFLGILKYSKFLIITSDSVSMCSEAASTGHPLYIYTPDGFTSKKHKYFVQQLIDLGIARPLTTKTPTLEEYSYIPLNEVAKVAKAVKALL
jgi:mitochondrial fission protein ELM1